MVSTASAKGHIPRDLGVVFVSLLEPTNTHGMAQFHFRRSPPGGRTWCEDTNVREIPAAFVAFMELSRLSCFNASLIAASDSTYRRGASPPLRPRVARLRGWLGGQTDVQLWLSTKHIRVMQRDEPTMPGVYAAG